MDGLTISFLTLVITIFVSLLVALIVKMMTLVLHNLAQQRVPDHGAVQSHLSAEAEIAAAIAITQAQQK